MMNTTWKHLLAWMYPLLSASILLTSREGYAQKLNPEFGLVTPQDMATPPPADESDSEAMVLHDIGKSRFEIDNSGNFIIVFQRTKRVKVFSRSGTRHAEVSIPYYVENDQAEKVIGIQAISHNEEGVHIIMRRLDPKTVYDEQISERWHVKKFVVPAVKENTIIEYRYTVESPFFFNLPDWQFQDDIPTQYSEYSVGINPFYEYDFIAQGIAKFDYQNSQPEFPKKSYGEISYNDMVTIFIMKNTPSFKNEPFISSREDYVMKVDFQLSKVNRLDGTNKLYRTTWPDLSNQLLENDNFGKYINSSRRLARDLLSSDPSISGESADARRLQAIVNYVRAQLRWNGQNSHYATKSPKEVWSQKTGNSAELNLFLLAMLQEAGADALPVLLSTRDHGKVYSEYPFEHFFNYVIVFVNSSKSFLADATENQLAYDRLPIQCLNGDGLVVNKNHENWVNLQPAVPSLRDVSITLKVNDAANAEITGVVQSTEYESLYYRKRYEGDTTRMRLSISEEQEIKVRRVASLNYSTPSRPYVITFNGNRELERVGNKIVVQPFLFQGFRHNPLHRETRTFPVDLIFPQSQRLKGQVIVPQGYKLQSLPEPFNLDNEVGTISFRCVANGTDIIVQADYSFKKVLYPPEDYSLLRSFFSSLIDRLSPSIVLEQ